MISVYSNVDGQIICNIIHKNEIDGYRRDLSPENEIIQVCARKIDKGVYVQAHRHFPTERVTIGTQESWIILDGVILAGVYDIDNALIKEVELYSGSCIVFFRGGHSLKVLTDNTYFYEFKNGPYHGYENDKYNI